MKLNGTTQATHWLENIMSMDQRKPPLAITDNANKIDVSHPLAIAKNKMYAKRICVSHPLAITNKANRIDVKHPLATCKPLTG